MSPSDLNALPLSQRLKVIEELWDSIEADASEKLPLPDWHRDEITRRLDALDSGASIGTPWIDVRRRIVGRT